MRRIHNLIESLRTMDAAGALRAAIWRDTRGQDLIEYAMMAGFVALACAAIIPYGVAQPITSIFSRLVTLLSSLGNAGG